MSKNRHNKIDYKKIVSIVLLLISQLIFSQENEKHLFILSGQSNMQLLRPNESFKPILNEEFGKKNVAVVKYALGSMPIRRWYKDWKPTSGDTPKAEPDLYDSLMVRVKEVIKKRKINPKNAASVTFIWMQGERDARKEFGEVYEKSLLGLYKQLSDDLGIKKMNLVIGRLSDCGLKKKGWPHWQMIRDIQVNIANSNKRFGWIDTDDLNTGVNRNGKTVVDDIHMTKVGYVIMGERFAKKAIELIEINE